MNHATEEQLVLYGFGDLEPDESASLEEHLHACEACRAQLASVGQTLRAISRIETPERGEGYGAEVWARLQPRLEASRGSWWSRTPWSYRFAYASGVAVLLVAVVVGRSWIAAPPASSPPAAAPTGEAAAVERVRERVLLLAVSDHLERSQLALVELMNAGGAGPIDISVEQERVRDLVSENRLYRQTAAQAGENGVAGVLDELERVLLEVANGPSRVSTEELERVRGRIEEQGIIFKLRVLGDRVRQREAPREAAGV